MFLQQQLRHRKYNMKNMDEQYPVRFLMFSLYTFRDALLTMHSYFSQHSASHLYHQEDDIFTVDHSATQPKNLSHFTL